VQPADAVENVLSEGQDANSKFAKPMSVLLIFLQNMIAVGTRQLLTIEVF
jgi:hypothetical protein